MAGCDQVREQLSARLDGEQDASGAGYDTAVDGTAVDGTAVDAHLAACPHCRQWYEDAATVTRMARTGAAPAPVDVTDAVLAAAPGPGRARVALALRLLLAVLGGAQLLLGLAQVTAVTAGGTAQGDPLYTGATPGHLWHESAAWNAAVGAGFLWIALRRGQSGGIVVMLTAFVTMLLLLNVGDLSAGRVEFTHAATHSMVLLGYLVVLALTRPALRLDRPPAGSGQTRPWWRRESRAGRFAVAWRGAATPGVRRLPAAGPSPGAASTASTTGANAAAAGRRRRAA